MSFSLIISKLHMNGTVFPFIFHSYFHCIFRFVFLALLSPYTGYVLQVGKALDLATSCTSLLQPRMHFPMLTLVATRVRLMVQLADTYFIITLVISLVGARETSLVYTDTVSIYCIFHNLICF